jgi:hypothetical protein
MVIVHPRGGEKSSIAIYFHESHKELEIIEEKHKIASLQSYCFLFCIVLEFGRLTQEN